jgi:hypothetical protein
MIFFPTLNIIARIRRIHIIPLKEKFYKKHKVQIVYDCAKSDALKEEL